MIQIDVAKLSKVTSAAKENRLDFDDAYVYTAAEMHDLTIVSFDADFDRTPRGRKTPGQALAELNQAKRE